MSLKDIPNLLKETFSQWNEDEAQRLGAALAYYTIFSLAPLLIIVIAIAGFVLGREAVQNQILDQIQGLIGPSGKDLLQTMIAHVSEPKASAIASIIGIVTLALGAAAVFSQLRDALNTIWNVEPKPGPGGLASVVKAIKDNFLSFTMVLGTGFLLLVSLVLSAALSALANYLGNLFPGLQAVIGIVNFVVSFAVIVLLFALMFKFVPDTKVAWRDVWIGAIVTALLFVIGRFVIGRFIATSATASTYGAAGSLVLILIWIYYSAQIVFLGAEFTQVYANEYGSRIVAAEDAMPLTEEARAHEGMPRKEEKEAMARGKQKPVAEPGSAVAAASTTGASPTDGAEREEVIRELAEKPGANVYFLAVIGAAIAGFIGGLLGGRRTAGG